MFHDITFAVIDNAFSYEAEEQHTVIEAKGTPQKRNYTLNQLIGIITSFRSTITSTVNGRR